MSSEKTVTMYVGVVALVISITEYHNSHRVLSLVHRQFSIIRESYVIR